MKNFINICLLLMTAVSVSAHDFSVEMKNGQKLFFNVTDSVAKEVEITYEGNFADDNKSPYSGELSIKPTIVHNGKTYNIRSIGKKAFCNAEYLESIELPMGLKEIGDFAFENCTSLRRIVFGPDEISIGQGAFFGCRNMENISIGSEWSAIDFSDFRWSRKIKVFEIPAKVKSIRNMKNISTLEKIEINSNNSRFKSHDGVLYSKENGILLGCPRGKKGTLNVAEGTLKILIGAISDCTQLTEVILPQTIMSFSFREFANLTKLQSLQIRYPEPQPTATKDGNEVMAIVTKNPNLKVYVAKEVLNTVQSMIVSESADYQELKSNLPQNVKEENARIPYSISSAELVNPKMIIGVKNFDNIKK